MKSLHFGSAMIDIITLVASDDIERLTFSNEGASFLMLETGRKVTAHSITSHVGGGACNTAVSLARQGWEAGVAAKVGRDLNASAVRAHLVANDVADRLIESDLATGTAVMIASHDRNASILVHRGANEALVIADLPDLAGTDLVYLAPMSSASADCFAEIARRARAAGAMVAANPGIRQLTTRLEGFLAALPALDLLSVNRVEAETLLPAVLRDLSPTPAPDSTDQTAPPLLRRGLRDAGLRFEVADFLAAIQALGPRWVSLTDGTDGSYLAGPDGVLWHPSLPAEVAGTAGAGDAFCSTLTAALAEGVPAETAMRRASINAASVVSEVDTTAGLLATGALQARVDAVTGHDPVRLG